MSIDMSTETEKTRIKGFNKGDAKEQREYSRGGIKFFYPKPDFQPRFTSYKDISSGYLRDEKHIWMPEETLEAADILFTHRRLNIVGSPQMGKGTILYGLSGMLGELGKPYIFIEGHRQETPAEEVVAAIEKAQEEGAAVLYDSFDYNFAGSRSGVRTITVAKQMEKTPRVVNALAQATVPVAITSHDEEWTKLFLNLSLKEQFKDQLDTYQEYKIPSNLRSEKSALRFLLDHGYSPEDAQFLIDSENNPQVLNAMINNLGDKEKVQKVFDALKKYPVLKDLVRPKEEDGRVEEFLPILGVVRSFASNPSLLESKTNADYFKHSVSMLSQIILESDYKRIFLAYTRKMK